MFYASYGTFIHKIIERFYKGEIDREELSSYFLTRFSRDVKGERPKKSTVEKYIENGLSYFESFQPLPGKMIAVEKELNFKIKDIPFICYIDYIGSEDDKFIIIDNKSRALKPRSTRVTPTQKDLELDSMLKQLYIYSAALEQNYGELPSSLYFNCFRTNTIIKEQFKNNVYNNAIDWACNKVEEIKSSDNFHPNIDFFSCNYICGISDRCCYKQSIKRGGSKKH